jgi:hypothetical protein
MKEKTHPYYTVTDYQGRDTVEVAEWYLADGSERGRTIAQFRYETQGPVNQTHGEALRNAELLKRALSKEQAKNRQDQMLDAIAALTDQERQAKNRQDQMLAALTDQERQFLLRTFSSPVPSALLSQEELKEARRLEEKGLLCKGTGDGGRVQYYYMDMDAWVWIRIAPEK